MCTVTYFFITQHGKQMVLKESISLKITFIPCICTPMQTVDASQWRGQSLHQLACNKGREKKAGTLAEAAHSVLTPEMSTPSSSPLKPPKGEGLGKELLS